MSQASQAEPSDRTGRSEELLANLMEAAQLLLHALDPLDPSEPGMLLDALLALAEEDGVPRNRPADPVRRQAARLLAAGSVHAVESLEAKARSDLVHAVRVVAHVARALRELPDPGDPVAQELHELLGWALTAVRNHASDARHLAVVRARARQTGGVVRDHPWPRPRLALTVRLRRTVSTGSTATAPSSRPSPPSAARPSHASRRRPSDEAGLERTERRWPPPYRPVDVDGASTLSMGPPVEASDQRPAPSTAELRRARAQRSRADITWDRLSGHWQASPGRGRRDGRGSITR
jgi:hypothetical protein